MKLIVGLGNPGKKYEHTRHNIGFMIVDKYLGDVNWQNKFNADYTKTRIFNEDVIFIKPQTYMNLSGDSVIKFIKYFDIDIENILVIQDDLDMNIGNYKLKKNSSSGGHNGIKSIENSIGSKAFARLKIGILNNFKHEVVDFVLGKLSEEDKNIIYNINCENIINMFIKEGFDNTINSYKN